MIDAMKCEKMNDHNIIIAIGVTSKKRKMRRHIATSWPSSLLLLLGISSGASTCSSFTSSSSPRRVVEYPVTRQQQSRGGVLRNNVVLPLAVTFSTTTASTTTESASSASSTSSTLPDLYPKFATILSSRGYVSPTPIQRSSALLAREGENLLLIAATGSGKTLAYFLPALSRACDGGDGEDGNDEGRKRRRTVLIVAPTRELSAQLARDASLLLPDDDDGTILSRVVLAVRGIPPPTPAQLGRATVLIGTPNELHAVLTRISGAQSFLAGDTLSGVILDEVDVLLPPPPKGLRTSFDVNKNDAQQERKKLEQRRKLRAAQRRGVEFHGGSSSNKGKSLDSADNTSNGQVLTPTERLLRLIASSRHVVAGTTGDRIPLQVLAGSATASRAALDRLNRALRAAAMEGGVIGAEGIEGVWGGRMQVCRPDDDDDVDVQMSSSPADDSNPAASTAEATHTIRAVTVPSVVDHRYVFMSKDTVTSSHDILANVAKIARLKSPETSLVFICGEFSRSLSKEKEREVPKVVGKTSQARRNNAKKGRVLAASPKKTESSSAPGGPGPLSVRRACSILQSMGVDAHPMHVVLGLEPNAGEDGTMMGGEEEEEEEDGPSEVELPPVLVTFEGSARGLHFDAVDYVFVVGRPTSAASYLHLAGRVGRAMPSSRDNTEGSGEVEVRPGTIVSFCSKGRVGELQKWTSQVGATGLEEIVL